MPTREGIFGLGIIFSLVLLGVFIYLGIMAKKRILGDSDYYVAGRSIGPVTNALAITSSYLSLATFLGYTAWVWGMQSVLTVLAQAWMAGLVLIIALLCGPIRRLGEYTTAGYIGKRFHSQAARMIAVVFMILIMSIYSVGQMKGLANLFEILFGISFIPALFLGGTVVIIYVAFGGMYGVSWTQAVQGAVLFGALAICVTAIMKMSGASVWYIPWFGYGNMVPTMLEAFPKFFSCVFTDVTPKWYISVTFSMTFALAAIPHFISRVASSKNVHMSRRALVIGTFFIGAVILFTFCAGFAGLLYTKTNNIAIAEVQADKLILLLSDAFLGSWGLAICMAGALSAGISTIAGGLMVIGTGIAHDIIANIKQLTPAQSKALAPIAIIIAGIAVMLITINPPAFVLSSVIWAITLSGTIFIAPLIMGIWWKGTNKYGAMAGMLVGGILSLFFNISFAHPSFSWSPVISKVAYGPIPYPGGFAIPASFIAVIAVSMITNRMPSLAASVNYKETNSLVELMHGWSEDAAGKEQRYTSETGPMIILLVAITFFIYALV